MREAFSIPGNIITLLQVPHPRHDEALELYEAGEFTAADTAFQEAAELSKQRTIRLNEIVPDEDDQVIQIARDVAYGRVLLHWAISTEAQYRHEQDAERRREMMALAFARAARGLVLLEQDEHRIVGVEEKDAARDTVRALQIAAEATLASANSQHPEQPQSSLPQMDPEDKEIIETADNAKWVAA